MSSEDTTGNKPKLSSWLIGLASSVTGGIVVYIFTQLPFGKPTVELTNLYNLGQHFSVDVAPSSVSVDQEYYVLSTSGWGTIRDVEIVVPGADTYIEFEPEIYFNTKEGEDGTKAILINSMESGSEFYVFTRNVRSEFKTATAKILAVSSSNASTKMNSERGGLEGSFFDYFWFFVAVFIWGSITSIGLFSSSKTKLPNTEENGTKK